MNELVLEENITPKIRQTRNTASFRDLTNNLLTRIVGCSVDEVKEILLASLEEICKHFSVEDALILLYNHETVSWQVAYDWHLSGLKVHPNRLEPLTYGTFPWSEKKILANQEVLINNLAEIPESEKKDYAFFSTVGMQSLLSEPLIGKGKSIQGCIVLGTYSKLHHWSQRESNQLRYYSTLLGNILAWVVTERERLKHESFISLSNRFTQIALESKSYKIASEKIVNYLYELIPADFCGFLIRDEEVKTLVPVAAFGELRQSFLEMKFHKNEKTMTDVVLRNQQPLLIEDLPSSPYKNFEFAKKMPLTSLMVLPLRSESNEFGSIALGYQTRHDFSKDEIQFGKLAARQISLSLNKMILLEKNQHQVEVLNSITVISAYLRNAQSLAEIPEIVIQKVLEIVGVHKVALVILDSTASHPSIFHGGGGWQTLNLTDFLARYPLCQKSLQSKTLQHARQHDQTNGEEEYLLTFPLLTHNQSMGALCAGSETPFTNERINILFAVADLLANAIYRQSLVDNLQIQVETQRKMRMQLTQSEKLAALGQLVAGVAHELNNPLTTISLWAGLLQQQSISEQEKYDLGKILSESHRAANIVNGLLDFSRQHPPEHKTVDINVLIQSTVDMINFELKKSNVSCHLHLCEKMPLTVADPYQLKQVFLNLINNAIQAMDTNQQGKNLTIQSEVGASQYYNQLNPQENVIRVLFEDNGSGIPPALLPKIFDPFFTTKPNGTGLGLSVCHGIITEHGGNIWAESNEAQGTKMLLELPIEEPDGESERMEVVPTVFTSTKLARILVIDDEPSVLEVMQRALMRKGYLVESVEGGQEALDLFKSQHYDLAICDIRMPGMDGLEFYHRLGIDHPEMLNKLIFTTGDAISFSSQSFLKLSKAKILSKPFELEKLLQVVRETLAASKPEEIHNSFD